MSKIPKDAHAIIIGAMKSGTTSFYNYLIEHPQICASLEKEPEFFSEHQEHGTELENYQELWNFDSELHKYALEASTGYTKYPVEKNVAKNIYQYDIQPKLIYIVRNPFDRIESHFNFMQTNKSWEFNITDKYLINISRYNLQLDQYQKYFPKNSILVLDFAELKNNPQFLLKKTYDFLELSEYVYPTEYSISNRTESISKIEHKVKKMKSFIPDVPFILKIGRGMKNFLRKTNPQTKKRITDFEKEFIYRQLKDDMEKLNKNYGIDVSKWGF
ncbi:MAG: hypothetical protein GF372_14085 [Candidatus Marinimicrobia bacterium]|nr:hypothetical protein [Candidatus Neomarinimicrobiota bacterium]